jgi:hypothetical protein
VHLCGRRELEERTVAHLADHPLDIRWTLGQTDLFDRASDGRSDGSGTVRDSAEKPPLRQVGATWPLTAYS